jgi:hypothetical protein
MQPDSTQISVNGRNPDNGAEGAALPQDTANHFMTRGEHKFNRLTYNYIGYIANALLSVVAVFWAERTESGQKFIHRIGELAGKIPSVNPETTKFLATKTFFLAGGFAVLMPMKWLENKKSVLVKRWNQEIYGAPANTDPVLLQSQKEVEEAPRQTWLSIFGSRMLALVPFYATVGLLWDRKSILSKLTNPELRAMSKDAIKTMEQANPAGFSQIAGKGFYFDRPIAAASRWLGKTGAKLTGNHEALATLDNMQKRYPGMIKQGAVGSHDRDTIHSSLPYYFISEAITSAMVAWGVFLLTRVLGPVFDRKPHSATTPSAQSVSPPVILDTTVRTTEPSVLQAPQPDTKIHGRHVEHTAPDAPEMLRA